jgi:hypothetical protein
VSACTCPACSEAFTGLGAFDRHQSIAYGTESPVTCHDPAERGLVKQASGRWGFPATDDSRARLANLRAERGLAGVTGTAGGPEAADSPLEAAP